MSSTEHLAARDVAGTAPLSDGLSDENAEWLRLAGVDLDRLVSLERVRHERPSLVRTAQETLAKDGPKAKILRFLAFEGETATVGYDELTAVVSVERRTVRYHVAGLDDADLVERVSLGPSTVVAWPSIKAYLLVSDILSLFEW